MAAGPRFRQGSSNDGLWQALPVSDRRAEAAFDRAESLRRLSEERFDVLVVGGGITGAGIALDAASRGLRVALVEKGDFASGTSSRSTDRASARCSRARITDSDNSVRSIGKLSRTTPSPYSRRAT